MADKQKLFQELSALSKDDAKSLQEMLRAKTASVAGKKSAKVEEITTEEETATEEAEG